MEADHQVGRSWTSGRAQQLGPGTADRGTEGQEARGGASAGQLPAPLSPLCLFPSLPFSLSLTPSFCLCLHFSLYFLALPGSVLVTVAHEKPLKQGLL